MAYNNKNILLKMVEIQNLVLEKKEIRQQPEAYI